MSTRDCNGNDLAVGDEVVTIEEIRNRDTGETIPRGLRRRILELGLSLDEIEISYGDGRTILPSRKTSKS